MDIMKEVGAIFLTLIKILFYRLEVCELTCKTPIHDTNQIYDQWFLNYTVINMCIFIDIKYYNVLAFQKSIYIIIKVHSQQIQMLTTMV